jgi:hypothetical protein
MTHVAVVNNETVLVIDRKENNPLLNAHNEYVATFSITIRLG